MESSQPREFRSRRGLVISVVVVLNIIWWMLMIAAIGMGATHLRRCTVQPTIPIYLIALGVVSILALSMSYTRNIWESGNFYVLTSCCAFVLPVVTLCWFIAGTQWVYTIYPPNFNRGDAPYCHWGTYMLAFVVTTLVWVAVSLTFVCGGCFMVVTCFKTVFARKRLSPDPHSFYGSIHTDTAGDV